MESQYIFCGGCNGLGVVDESDCDMGICDVCPECDGKGVTNDD